MQLFYLFMYFCIDKTKKKFRLGSFVWLFSVFVLVSGNTNSVSTFERSTLRSNALPHLRSSVSIAREHTLKIVPSAALRSFAPLLRSNTIADCLTFDQAQTDARAHP